MRPLDLDMIRVFREKFGHIKEEPLVLYGTGEKTRLLIENCPDFKFAGIMDRKQAVGQRIFGLTVLGEEAIKEMTEYIVIVCDISSVDIVFHRIASFTDENEIKVFHMSGKRMLSKKKAHASKGLFIDRNKYENAITESEIVSFDLFDTLITRECLYPDDLFEIMESELIREGAPQTSFAVKRKEAVNEAVKKYGTVFRMEDIYQIYVTKTGQDIQTGEALLAKEFELELQYSRPRVDVVQLLKFARLQRKKVILVSDMYMSRSQIETLLENCGMRREEFEDIIISCEIGKAKADGTLWEYVSDKYKGYRMIHFGDNSVSDLENPKSAGISALPVYSGLHMASVLLEDVWSKYEYSLMCRNVMGLFVAEVFNSPFSIDERGRIRVQSLRAAGYSFFGSLIKHFMDYLYREAEKKSQKILFLARDGWLLKMIADKYYAESGVRNEYFLVARNAISKATALRDDDIDDTFRIFSEFTQYNFKKFCKVIFDIDIRNDDGYGDALVKDADKEELLSYLKEEYGEQIKRNALRQNALYRMYLDKMEIGLNERAAFVNFVGGGITQCFLEKFGFGRNNEFYYFAVTPLNVGGSLKCPMHSVYESGSRYTSFDNAVVAYSMMGECVLTSPQSQFMGFDEAGEAVFAGDGINHEYESIRECHEGIARYFCKTDEIGINLANVPPAYINRLYAVLFDRDVSTVCGEIRNAFQMKDIVRSDQVYGIWSD